MLDTASQFDPTSLTQLLPDPGGFRYYSVAASVPHKDAATYRLTVDGLVERPTVFTLDELRALPQTRAAAGGDRDRAVEKLRDAAGDGRLTAEELDERVEGGGLLLRPALVLDVEPGHGLAHRLEDGGLPHGPQVA